MNDYDSRVDKIRSMIRACLESRENDEDFFSASDGEDCPSPASQDDLPREEWASQPCVTADDDDAATAEGSIDDGEEKEETEAGCNSAALPAHEGDAPATAAQESRRMSASTTSLPNGIAEVDSYLADEDRKPKGQQEEQEERNSMPCEARQRSEREIGTPLGAGTNVALFAGISVSGLRRFPGMPILPGVDGVLLELRFLGTPLLGMDGLQPIEPEEYGNNTTSYRRPKTESAVHSDCLASDRVRDFRPCVFVGAVGLLLSEISGAWREMESPLFDRAGGISGTIKLAARMLGGEPQDCEAADASVSAKDAPRLEDGQETARSATPRGAEGSNVAAQASAAAEAAGSPLSTPERGKTNEGNYLRPKKDMEVREGQRDCGGQPAAVSLCCRRGGGSNGRARLCPAELSFADHRGAMNTAAAANEANPSAAITADEMAPRAVIIYRGMRLPFRWFRSGTARGMDEALREALGINDVSTPSPRLYDIESGHRVHLEPSIPSGRTFLAGLEPCLSPRMSSLRGGLSAAADEVSSSYHSEKPQPSADSRSQQPRASKDGLLCHLTRADGPSFHHHRRQRRRDGAVGTCTFHDQGSPRLLRPTRSTAAPRSRCLARRSASAGDLRRGSPYAATTTGDGMTAEGASASSPKQTLREPGRSEATSWRRVAEQHSVATAAAAAARRLACRLLCRGHRTRLLIAALWRWRSHAARLGQEQARRDEKERENEQALDLLEQLRQEVASLTTLAHEDLMVVSIDALEKDFEASGERVTDAKTTTDLAAPSYMPYGHDKDLAVAALRADISRLADLQAQKAQCLLERTLEARCVKETIQDQRGLAIAASASKTAAATATAHKREISPPLSPRTTPTTAHSRRNGDSNGGRRSASLGRHGGANPAPSLKEQPDVTGASPVHPGGGGAIPDGCPPPKDPHDGRGEGARAGGSWPDTFSRPPSPFQSRAAEADGGSKSRGGTRSIRPLAVLTEDPWEIVAKAGGRDEVLEDFLARHAEEGEDEACPQAWGMAGGRRLGELTDGAAGNGRGLMVLWALFRAFSDCPSQPCYFPPSTPTTRSGAGGSVGADGPAARPPPGAPDVSRENEFDGSGRRPQRRVGLKAFLEVCRRAGLLSPAVSYSLSLGRHGGLFAKEKGKGRNQSRGNASHPGRGRGDRESGGAAGGEDAREAAAAGPAAVKVAAPGGSFFLLDPADAAGIFSRATRGCRAESRRRPRDGGGNLSSLKQGTPWVSWTNDIVRGNEGRSALEEPSNGTGPCAEVYRGCRAGAESVSSLSQYRAETRGKHQQQRCRQPQPHRGRRYQQNWVCEGTGLGFAQFVAAIEGIIELLTIGYDGSDGDDAGRRGEIVGDSSADGCCNSKNLSERPTPPESSEDENDVSRNDASPRPSSGKLMPGGAGGEREDFRREEERPGGGRGRRRVTTMAPALARRRLVQLAKELAEQEMVTRDRQARETLALLDPSLQSALDDNSKTLFAIFKYYCPKPARRSPAKENDAPGIAEHGDGGRGGLERVSRSVPLGLSFEGGKALAADFGLVASPRQFAEVWDVAWMHQRAEIGRGREVDESGHRVGQAEEAGKVASKVLSFSGFLDFLGRLAVRFAPAYQDRAKRGLQTATQQAPGLGVRSSSASSPRHGPDDECGHYVSPGLSMLTLLNFMRASSGFRDEFKGGGKARRATGSKPVLGLHLPVR